eukprot:CAMPEP_0181473436 /NCGR_PEP_ID=MMETSP1110-20121109/40122_1 /TAXON_ID=174948 /ORGANISM="Symbiodinium sp., Strain CCMP421" /LENGTH=444 /DNA_ID=CAMNT_0023598551 /DNA_START=39 /DNA_END=1370 /DNA_ORIENTATION=-
MTGTLSTSIDDTGACAEEFVPPPNRNRIFALIVVGTFCGQLGLSILTPFFPAEAAAKHVQATTLGWIFSIFELATMVGTPITTRLLVRFGSKPMLVLGNLLGGVANILNGLCWYASDGVAFVSCCLLLRVIAGFAFAFTSTAGYSLLSPLFGDKMSTATGILEGVNGLALILGPIVGSTLFSLGGGASQLGYVMPFVVLGGAEAVFAFLNVFLLPQMPTPPARQPSLTKFSGKVLLACLNCVVAGISLGLLNPTLQPHLAAAPLHCSVQMVGFVFAACCGSYAVLSVLAGAVDDCTKGRMAIYLMAFGAFLSGIAFLMLGPAPIEVNGHELELSSALLWASTAFLGSGVAFGLIPVFKQVLSHAKHESAEERELAASSVFTLAMATGSFLGPTLGGLLSDLVGVRKAYAYSGLLEIILSVVLLIMAMTPAFRIQSAAGPALLAG